MKISHENELVCAEFHINTDLFRTSIYNISYKPHKTESRILPKVQWKSKIWRRGKTENE